MRRCHSLARLRRNVDDQAGLAAVFGCRRSLNNLQRLNGIKRNLVGEDFALLVGDGLAVHRKRVLGVIAKAVEGAIRIGRDSRGVERDRRAQRRGRALQRKSVERPLVRVGVGRGVILDQVSAVCLNCHGRGRSRHLQLEGHGDRHGRARLHVLLVAGKACCRDGQVVVVEGNVIELESSRAVGGHRPVKPADWVSDFDLGIGYHSSRGVEYRAVDGAGVAGGLCAGSAGENT